MLIDVYGVEERTKIMEKWPNLHLWIHNNISVPVMRKYTEVIIRISLWLLESVNLKVTGFEEDY